MESTMTRDMLPADLLRLLYPFSLLSTERLDEIRVSSRILHVPERETPILDPSTVGVVFSGRFILLHQDVPCEHLLIGDVLGFAAVLDPELPRLEIQAVENAGLLMFPLDLFMQMLRDEDRVHAHFTTRADRLAFHIENAKLQQQNIDTGPYLRLAVGSLSLPEPLCVPATICAVEAAKCMSAGGVAACLIGEPGSIRGILTERDVASLAARGGQALDAAKVVDIMTPGLITVGKEELVFEAFSKMVHRGIRRLVVIDAAGNPVGLLQERDMLLARGENPLHLARRIADARTPHDLSKAAAALRNIVLRCAAEGIGVEHVGRLVADMNDHILVRTAGLVIEEMGQAPATFSLMVLGSEGRKEQFLATDQDNALVFADNAGPDSEDFFARFARRFSDMLTEIGFPRCPHKVMVDNPSWRFSLTGWKDQVDAMVFAADASAVLRLAMLADARHIFGNPGLCDMLRTHLQRRIASSPVLLKYLSREAMRFDPPIGFFRNLVVERSGPAKGCMDIKKGAIFPITQGLKTLALEYGVTETGSMERLHGLCQAGVFSSSMASSIRESYDFLQSLRLKAQAQKVRAKEAADSYVCPEHMPPMERERLKDCLRIVIDFQSFLHTKYGLHLIS